MKKSKIVYYDYLRVIAVLAVIMIHVSAEYLNKFDNNYNWYLNNFMNCLAHAWPVPLFVTISGSLLLGNQNFTIKTMVMKYLPRIIIALVFWHYFYAFYTNGFTIDNFIFSTKALLLGNSYSHLWYLYLLVGLYLLTPILSKLAHSLSKNEFLYLLILGFGLSVFIPYGGRLLNIDLEKFILPYEVLIFNRFIFYYLLGYYLKKYVSIKNTKWLVLSIVLLIITSFYSLYASYVKEFPLSYCGTDSIVSICLVVTIFCFFKEKWNSKSEGIISILGDLSFGIYLIHFFVEKLLLKLDINAYLINAVVGNLFTTFIIFEISAVICYGISRIPYVKKLIGL